jgi:hypothetical protein
MARQRIVINVDGPPSQTTVRGPRASGRKPRRWLRVLAILAGLVLIVVVVAAVGVFLWWRNYQTTPAYAVTLLAHAAQQNDVAEFEKRINDEEIAKNMVASVSQKASARYGLAINSSVQAQIDKLVPSLLPRLKQTIHDEVVQDIRLFASKSEPRGFFTLLVVVPRWVNITAEGDAAKVKVPLLDREVELTMHRNDDRWQVTEVKDDVLVQRVVDNVMKDLPAIGSIDSNSPLFKKPQRRRSRKSR